jgi:hypothetical protein
MAGMWNDSHTNYTIVIKDVGQWDVHVDILRASSKMFQRMFSWTGMSEGGWKDVRERKCILDMPLFVTKEHIEGVLKYCYGMLYDSSFSFVFGALYVSQFFEITPLETRLENECNSYMLMSAKHAMYAYIHAGLEYWGTLSENALGYVCLHSSWNVAWDILNQGTFDLQQALICRSDFAPLRRDLLCFIGHAPFYYAHQHLCKHHMYMVCLHETSDMEHVFIGNGDFRIPIRRMQSHWDHYFANPIIGASTEGIFMKIIINCHAHVVIFPWNPADDIQKWEQSFRYLSSPSLSPRTFWHTEMMGLDPEVFLDDMSITKVYDHRGRFLRESCPSAYHVLEKSWLLDIFSVSVDGPDFKNEYWPAYTRILWKPIGCRFMRRTESNQDLGVYVGIIHDRVYFITEGNVFRSLDLILGTWHNVYFEIPGTIKQTVCWNEKIVCLLSDQQKRLYWTWSTMMLPYNFSWAIFTPTCSYTHQRGEQRIFHVPHKSSKGSIQTCRDKIMFQFEHVSNDGSFTTYIEEYSNKYQILGTRTNHQWYCSSCTLCNT